jgi:hypothetical protein
VPRTAPSRTPEDRVQVIAALRRLRLTGGQIAEALEMPETTVSGIPKRIGTGRLGRLGHEPAVRRERQCPGELVHVDVKKLGRIQRGAGKRITGGKRQYTGSFTDAAGRRRGKVGWDFVHVAIDDATPAGLRRGVWRREGHHAVAFLRRARAFYASYGTRIDRGVCPFLLCQGEAVVGCVCSGSSRASREKG